jgi:hypothetical protein
MSSTERAAGRPCVEMSTANPSRSASYAAAAASSSHRRTVVRNAATDAGRIYVEAVLDLYLWLPGTPARTSRHDRGLARTLYERGVPQAVVRAALLLGAARRAFRGEEARRLPPIRTLHFFLPLIEEVIEDPPAPGYAEYLEGKLRPLADAKVERR